MSALLKLVRETLFLPYEKNYIESKYLTMHVAITLLLQLYTSYTNILNLILMIF